jgi:hypothetical protein
MTDSGSTTDKGRGDHEDGWRKCVDVDRALAG